MDRRKVVLAVFVGVVIIFLTYLKLEFTTYKLTSFLDYKVSKPPEIAPGIYDRKDNLLDIAINHNPLHYLRTPVVVNGTKKTSSTYFTYSESGVFSAIQRLRAETNYKPPKNEACKKRVPKCIILGVKKSGTRELIDFMSLHPNIVIKRDPYEFGYFSGKHYKQNASNTEWYRNQMPCSYSDQITVTKYAWYFSSPVAAQRIHNFNQAIKLIVIVREPIKRLVSGFTFKIPKHGRDLSKLPKIESRLLLRNGKINKRYEEVKLSSYDDAIINYLKFFSLDQILVVESNEFKFYPHLVLKRIESFLGLQHITRADNFVFNEDKNFHCIKNQNHAACYGTSRGRKIQPGLSEDIQRKLKNYFQPHNENFFDIIGKRYNW